jgi:membrane-associated phospholipid phosphatase
VSDPNHRSAASRELASDPCEGLSPIERADVHLSRRLARNRRHPVARAVKAAAGVGDQEPLVALSVATIGLGLGRRDRRLTATGARMLASLFVSIAAKTALKRLVLRTRPHVVLDEGVYELRAFGPNEGPQQSFPSGHTAGSVAVARAVARRHPELGAAAYAGAAAIAIAQVPTAKHFATDVLAGAAIGYASDALIARLVPALRDDAET